MGVASVSRPATPNHRKTSRRATSRLYSAYLQRPESHVSRSTGCSGRSKAGLNRTSLLPTLSPDGIGALFSVTISRHESGAEQHGLPWILWKPRVRGRQLTEKKT